MSDAAPTAAPAATGGTEGTPDVGTPGAEGTPANPAAATPELFEVVVNGQKMKWSRERVIAEAQKSAAGQKAFEEAARLRKEVEAFKGRFKDPEALDAFVKEQGYEDPAEFFREHFGRHLKPRLMKPEERAAHEQAEENKRLKAELEKRDAAEKTARKERLKDELAKHYDTGMVAALKEMKLPSNPYTIKRMAETALAAFIDKGQEPNWKVVAQMVDEDLYGGLAETLDSIEDEETLGRYIREGTRKRLRQADLKRLRGGASPAGKPDPKAAAEAKAKAEELAGKQENKKGYMTREELHEYLDRVKKGEVK
jgi:hypothetical protein